MCIEGVNSSDLGNVLDYIYNGEVQVFQEGIDRFLEVAQRFKLEGLLGGKEEDPSVDIEEPVMVVENKLQRDNNQLKQETKNGMSKPSNQRIIVHNNANSGEVSEIDQQIQEHMEKVSDGWSCKICGKGSVKLRAHMRNHIETHLEGLSFDCQHC